LAQEALLLEDARRLLGTRPIEGLARLQEHAALYPRGKLWMERELMTVDALRRCGRRQEARQAAEALLERARGSLYEARVRGLLESVE